MKTGPVVPARVVYDADGRPRSLNCGDIYFPRQGALAQARHVFMAGSGLPARWQARPSFVILETGFGFGNNFLAAWAAWRADALHPARLHFVSIERSPPSREELRELAREPELVALGEQLAAAWPPLTCNLHRLDFDGGAVRLSLAFGSVAAWLPQIVARVDAFFLDGFAPACNPEMWEPRLFRALARHAALGATVATWTAARDVRAGLRSAGFAVQPAAGSGGKRDITLARFEPAFVPRGAARDLPPTARSPEAPGDHRSKIEAPVLIIGAGLAGCAVAAALAACGRRSLLIERNDAIADEGSGNQAALFHGVVHADDGRHARFFRAAALLAQRVVGEAVAAHGVSGATSGLLRLAPDAASREVLSAIAERLGLPHDYAVACSAAEASERAGLGIAAPAWYFPGGGWVAPRELAAFLLRGAGALCELRTGIAIAELRRDGSAWHLRGAEGKSFEAATLVLANADGVLAGIGSDLEPLTRQHAQISGVAVEHWAGASPRMPIAGSGYLTPAVKGRIWFGASAVADDERADGEGYGRSHQANLARLGQLLARPPQLALADLSGRRGFRWASADRLPIIGAVPARTSPERDTRVDQPRFIERAPGLYACLGLGSRGIMSALLGAEIVAAAITGQPAPVEADLLDAVDPARFISRLARRGITRPASPR